MAGVITTGNHPKSLWPGIKAIFGRAYDQHEEEFSQIFEKQTSNKRYEERFEVTGFGLAPQKPEGSSISYDTESQGFVSKLVNVTYALGYICTYEELEDNLYEEVSGRRAQALAFSMRQTKENVGANVLNRAFNSSYTGGDGKELVATDHPTDSGTQSNELDPSADLSETSLEDLCIQIMRAQNTRGLKISLMPRKLIVPPQLVFEAERILKSQLQANTANNAVNALRSTGMFPDGITVNHYLTDPDAFFALTNCPEGMIYQERKPMEGLEQDNDFDTYNAKAKAMERYVFGWVDWRSMFASAGA